MPEITPDDALNRALTLAENTLRGINYGVPYTTPLDPKMTETQWLLAFEKVRLPDQQKRWGLCLLNAAGQQVDLMKAPLRTRILALRAIPALTVNGQRASREYVAEIEATTTYLNAFVAELKAAPRDQVLAIAEKYSKLAEEL